VLADNRPRLAATHRAAVCNWLDRAWLRARTGRTHSSSRAASSRPCGSWRLQYSSSVFLLRCESWSARLGVHRAAVRVSKEGIAGTTLDVPIDIGCGGGFACLRKQCLEVRHAQLLVLAHHRDGVSDALACEFVAGGLDLFRGASHHPLCSA